MEWETKKVSSVLKTSAGGTPRKSRKEYYEGGDIPWLLSGEVGQGEIYRSKNFITELGLQESSAKLFPEKTVLVAMYGATAGRVGLLRIEASTNQAVCGILPNDDYVSKFVYYFFLSKTDELIAKAVGNAQPNISQTKIKDVDIPVVPLPEQRRLVTLLDRAFADIERARALLERNLRNAEELFESRLGEVFNQQDISWKQKTLIEVSEEFGRGKSKHRPRNDKSLFGGEYPFVQTGDVRNAEKYVTGFTQTYNEKGLKQSKIWPEGTICITIAANIAETAILSIKACFPDSVIGMIVDEDKAMRDYVFYALAWLKSDLQAQGKGSAQDNINLGTFKRQLFPFPDLSKQQIIVDELNDLRVQSEILQSHYTTQLHHLTTLKQSLLQRAFAGKL